MRLDLAHPTLGLVPSIANPIKYSAAPVSYSSTPPTLGADTDEVLSNILGLEPADIEKLRDIGVI